MPCHEPGDGVCALVLLVYQCRFNVMYTTSLLCMAVVCRWKSVNDFDLSVRHVGYVEVNISDVN